MLKNFQSNFLFLLIILVIAPQFLFAHPNGTEASGVTTGFAHPFTGLDHLLAMLGVGIWAGQLKGKSVWLLPLSFTIALVIGGVLGSSGFGLPYVEEVIILSVIIFGLVIAFAYKAPLWVGIALSIAFALSHGHAHGTEMPASLSGYSYFIGMVVGSVLLQVIGISLAIFFNRENRKPAYRFIGISMMLTGVFLIFL